MNEDIKKPYEDISKAQKKYFEEWKKFSKNYHKLEEYIKPFVEQNKEYEKIMQDISASLIALPISNLVINTIHLGIATNMMKITRASIPPLKIVCHKCNTVVWDVTDVKDFLDPKGEMFKDDDSKK